MVIKSVLRWCKMVVKWEEAHHLLRLQNPSFRALKLIPPKPLIHFLGSKLHAWEFRGL